MACDIDICNCKQTSFGTLVTIYKFTWCNIPKDLNLYNIVSLHCIKLVTLHKMEYTSFYNTPLTVYKIHNITRNTNKAHYHYTMNV